MLADGAMKRGASQLRAAVDDGIAGVAPQKFDHDLRDLYTAD